jgi:hypothetical protein
MGRIAEGFMARIAAIAKSRGAGMQMECVPTPGLDDCMVNVLLDDRDVPIVATLMVGINENEDAVNRFALKSFSRFPPTCHRAIQFLGFDNDPRELFDIPEVCEKAKRLLFDDAGQVRPFVRLLCWSDFDTPTHTVPPAFKAWRESLGLATKGANGFPGILFLAMLAAGIKPRIVNTATGMRWMVETTDRFEHAVQRDVFGQPGKSLLDAGEIARFFRRRRAK